MSMLCFRCILWIQGVHFPPSVLKAQPALPSEVHMDRRWKTEGRHGRMVFKKAPGIRSIVPSWIFMSTKLIQAINDWKHGLCEVFVKLYRVDIGAVVGWSSSGSCSDIQCRQHWRLNICSYIGWIDKYCICQFNQYYYKYWCGSAV